MGKSALVKRFFEELRAKQNRLVLLRGRCYERESVPYKALDALIDSLSRYLCREPGSFVSRVIPRGVPRTLPALSDLPRGAPVRRTGQQLV